MRFLIPRFLAAVMITTSVTSCAREPAVPARRTGTPKAHKSATVRQEVQDRLMEAELAEDRLERVDGEVQALLRRSMVSGHRSGFEVDLEAMAEEEELEMIRIFNWKGELRWSSGMGREAAAGPEAVIGDVIERGVADTEKERLEDRTLVRRVTPIRPESACLDCHDYLEGKSSFGAVDLLLVLSRGDAGVVRPVAEPVCLPQEWPRSHRKLLRAIGRGDAETVRCLIRAGQPLNAADSGGTPLLAAVSKGDLEMVRLLVEAGADPNRYLSRERALTAAVRAGHVAIVSYLLDRGVEVNFIVGTRSETPLFLAEKARSEEIVVLLLEAGAKPYRRAGKLVSDTLAPPALRTALLTGRLVELRNLLEAGADPDETDSPGVLTPLARAALGRNREAAEILLEAGADAGRALTGAAGMKGGLDAAALLADRGAPLEFRSPSGLTPLLMAASGGSSDVAGFLLSRGASPSARDYRGRNGLHIAAGRGDAAMAILLAEAGCPVDGRDYDGLTPLMLLKKRKEDPHRARPQNRNVSAARVASVLIGHGAKVRATDFEGNSALHFAARAGEQGVALALVRAGADRLSRNAYGKTPFHEADGEGDALLRLILEPPRERSTAVAGEGEPRPRIAVVVNTPLTDLTEDEGHLVGERLLRSLSHYGPFAGKLAAPLRDAELTASSIARLAREEKVDSVLVAAPRCREKSCLIEIGLFGGADGSPRGKSETVEAPDLASLLLRGIPTAAARLIWNFVGQGPREGAPYLRIEQEGRETIVHDGDVVKLEARSFRLILRVSDPDRIQGAQIMLTEKPVWQLVRLGEDSEGQDMVFRPAMNMATRKGGGELSYQFHSRRPAAIPYNYLSFAPGKDWSDCILEDRESGEVACDIHAVRPKRSSQNLIGTSGGLEAHVLLNQEQDGRAGIGVNDLLRFRIILP